MAHRQTFAAYSEKGCPPVCIQHSFYVIYGSAHGIAGMLPPALRSRGAWCISRMVAWAAVHVLFVLLALAGWLVILSVPLSSLQAREVPRYIGRVNDYASRLSEDSELILEHISYAHEKKYGDRLVILTVDSLKDVDPEEFAIAALKQWELDGSGNSRGRTVLVLVAVLEKRVRIQISEDMEKYLHPNVSASILANAVLPELKKGMYSIGLYRAFHELTDHLASQHRKLDASEKKQDETSREPEAESSGK